MKVAQNDETIPDTQSVRPPHPSNLSNPQLSPPAPLPENTKHREYFPGCFPPFTGITSYRIRARLATHFALSCIVMHLFALYSLFLPPLLPLDTETDAAAAQFDYGVDDPSFLPEQPGKPPLDHQISPILLYTACIRVV